MGAICVIGGSRGCCGDVDPLLRNPDRGGCSSPSPGGALERLWAVEFFDRIVAPAPVGRDPGFSLHDLTWILANAPSETLVLRPAAAGVRTPAQSRSGQNGTTQPAA